MGSGASARLDEVANSSTDDLELALAWHSTVLDSVLILGDYAFLGAAALGKNAMENSVPFAEKGDKKLVCIVDTGHPHLFYSKFMEPEQGSLKDKEIETWVILLPSVASDPRFYGASLTQAMSVAVYICGCHAGADIRFVHRDFYYANPIGCGVDWLPVFLDKDEKILPSNQRASMLDWLETWVETVWNMRAGVHWAVGMGMEEGDLSAGPQQIVRQLLTDGKAVEDVTQYEAPGIALTVKVTQEAEDLHVACTNIAGDAVCSKAFQTTSSLGELASFLHEEFPDSSAPTFWKDSSELSSDTMIADYTSFTATRKMGGTGLPSILKYPHAHLKFAVGDVHGLANEFSLKQFEFDKAQATKWKSVADMTFFADVSSLNKDFDKNIELLREVIPANVFTLVVVAKDFDSFRCPNIACRLRSAIENFDTCVFATLDDVEKVKSVYLYRPACYPDGLVLCQAMIAFPRLHFFCLLGHDGKTCGREVPDQSMMFSSVKFGIGAPSLPSSKFARTQFMRGPDGPLHYVTLPGEDKATVIQPSHILVDIFRMALAAECNEGSKMDKSDALDNVRDIIREHAQYAGIQVDDLEQVAEEEEGERPPDRDPDGTLEDAQLFIRTMRLNMIKEVRSMCRPPPRMLPPMRACAVLLGHEVRAADDDGWKDCREMMADVEEFHGKILALGPDVVTAEQWAAVRMIAADPSFSFRAQSPCSTFSAIIAAWVLALLDLAAE